MFHVSHGAPFAKLRFDISIRNGLSNNITNHVRNNNCVLGIGVLLCNSSNLGALAISANIKLALCFFQRDF